MQGTVIKPRNSKNKENSLVTQQLLTSHQSQYYAWLLTRRAAGDTVESLASTLVISQRWAERRRRILILEAKNYNSTAKQSRQNPFLMASGPVCKRTLRCQVQRCVPYTARRDAQTLDLFGGTGGGVAQ